MRPHARAPRRAAPDAAQFPASTYDRVSRTIDAVTSDLPPGMSSLILSEYVGRRAQEELEHLSRRPDWMRASLLRAGQDVLVRLAKENWEHAGTSATVRTRFGIATSTLHRAKDEGQVIAFRPSAEGEFMFPLEQFTQGEIEEWPEKVVAAVGNGGPSLHFLYTKRASLDGRSFADIFRQDTDRTEAIRLITEAAERLGAE